MNKSLSSHKSIRQEVGAAILAITIIILFVATVGALMIGRVSVVEQKAAGADVRSKEVYAAVTGGLEYGVNWFRENYADLDWSDSDGDGNSCRGDTATPLDGMANTVLSDERGEEYTHQITYELQTCLNPESGFEPTIVTVISQAVAVGDSQVQKTVSVDVMLGETGLFQQGLTGGFNVLDAPPIIVAGCMNDLRGSSEVYAGAGIGVLTTRGIDRDNNGIPDSDEDYVDLIGEDGCMDTTRQGSGTEVVSSTNANPVAALATPSSVWNTVFAEGVTEADIEQMSIDSPEMVYYVTEDTMIPLNGNLTYGSLENPVIIYFDSSADCPGINGNITIYGLVYNEGRGDEGNVCDESNGWGSAEIFGTYVMDGNINSYNGSGSITRTTLDFGGGGDGPGGTNIDEGPNLVKFAEIPGSWRDY